MNPCVLIRWFSCCGISHVEIFVFDQQKPGRIDQAIGVIKTNVTRETGCQRLLIDGKVMWLLVLACLDATCCHKHFTAMPHILQLFNNFSFYHHGVTIARPSVAGQIFCTYVFNVAYILIYCTVCARLQEILSPQLVLISYTVNNLGKTSFPKGFSIFEK